MSLAGRPSVRVDHVRGWVLKENETFPEEHGEIVASCHDKSPFITIVCDCGGEMHLHETQVEGLRPKDEVVTRCKAEGGCGKRLVLGGRWMLEGFAEVKERMKATS